MMTFLNNHSVYHGRTAWKHDDSAASRDGLDNGRLLLRAWISPFNARDLPSDGPHGDAYREVSSCSSSSRSTPSHDYAPPRPGPDSRMSKHTASTGSL